MAVTSWAPRNSKRWTWLQGHKDSYLAALGSPQLQEWFTEILEQYFKTFHWSIPDDADPESHPIRDIDLLTDPTDAERERLVKEKTEAYVSKLKVCRQHQEGPRILTSSKQLKNWYYNHFGVPKKRAVDPQVTTPSFADLPNPGPLVASAHSRKKQLNKPNPVSRKGHRNELQVYIKLFHKTKFAEEVQQAMKTNQAAGASYLKTLTDIARKHFAEESDDIIQQVKNEVVRLREEDLAKNTTPLCDAEPATLET